MPYIGIRDVEHYYEWIRTPRSDSQAKPVMVFIHGWAGSARYWQSVADTLADSFDCLLYDLRGFGRSLGTPPTSTSIAVAKSEIPEEKSVVVRELTYELEEYAEDLALLLDRLQIEQVYLHAHSMGASIATLFLNRYPQRVDRAILTCSGIFEYDEKAFTAFHKFGGYVVKFRPKWLTQIPLVDRMFIARFLHRPIPAAERKAFLQDFLVADYQAALGTIFTSVSKQAAEMMPQEFTQISVPTLLVAGEYDKIIPAEMGRRAAQLNPLVEYAVIPETAHFPMLEDAETYLQTVRAFLEQPVKMAG
jgi:proline iminopeptidase